MEIGKIPHAVNKSPSLRVLVVDDESLIRWSLPRRLSENGHLVSEAGDGETALRTLTGRRIVRRRAARLPSARFARSRAAVEIRQAGAGHGGDHDDGVQHAGNGLTPRCTSVPTGWFPSRSKCTTWPTSCSRPTRPTR